MEAGRLMDLSTRLSSWTIQHGLCHFSKKYISINDLTFKNRLKLVCKSLIFSVTDESHDTAQEG
jgi:hypothetical protein